jgi:hypothetical protein
VDEDEEPRDEQPLDESELESVAGGTDDCIGERPPSE